MYWLQVNFKWLLFCPTPLYTLIYSMQITGNRRESATTRHCHCHLARTEKGNGPHYRDSQDQPTDRQQWIANRIMQNGVWKRQLACPQPAAQWEVFPLLAAGVECCFNRRRRLAILRGLDSECPHKLSRTVNWTYRRIIQLYRSTTSRGLYRHWIRRSRRKNPNWWVSNFELCGRLTRRVTLLTIYWTQQLVVNLLAHARHVPSTLVLWPAAAAAICCPHANHNMEWIIGHLRLQSF